VEGFDLVTSPVSAVPRGVISAPDWDFWEENGFLVLRGFFTDEEVDRVNEYVDRLWDGRRNNQAPIVLDHLLPGAEPGRCLIQDSPEGARDWPYKLNDLYLASGEVRALSIDPRLMAVLHALLDGEVMAINSLNFEKGSQQPYHFDTFFMPAPTKNKMLATWVALEDIEPSTGPLQYFPGSHLVEPHRFGHDQLWALPDEIGPAITHTLDRVAAAGLEENRFVPRKGDVFIWHSQLFHGGSPIDDMSRTRRSLVTHYFRVADFDLTVRAERDPQELRAQFKALAPAWRGAFVRPAVDRSADGQAYLDKWKIPPATPEEALQFGCTDAEA
jgi:phytanoyl-CoA hydroxylase